MRGRMTLAVVAVLALAAVHVGRLEAAELSGFYLETRTCQVYTGPCFANAEVGLAGKDAILAWSIQKGSRTGVDLAGLNVVVVVNSNKTLGFGGLNNGKLQSVILVDDRANAKQRKALVAFAKHHAGPAGKNVVRVDTAPVQMSLNVTDLKGSLTAGKSVKLTTRKARPEDCICSNESAYYPPLVKVENFVPGVTLEGKYSGRGLGSRWSTPNARSSYMATFAY